MTIRHASGALRTHRRIWGFSQRELGALLGYSGRTEVARIEKGKRAPSIEIALTCAALFGVSIKELFPQLSDQAERRFCSRATNFGLGSTHHTTPKSTRKRELISQCCALGRGNGNGI